MIVDNNLDLAMWEAASEQFPDVTIFCVPKGAPQALEYLHQYDYKFDAIISDLAMPILNGRRFTAILRENEEIRKMKRIPVFWFTGYPIDEPIQEERIRLGVVEIFRKPCDPLQMIETVKEYIA